tara:strand:- start:369 stop:488 length:120 start_codon:yes stop_codon:yes gene_type:complete
MLAKIQKLKFKLERNQKQKAPLLTEEGWQVLKSLKALSE